jgi:tripartite-type tricarboxylate transporter receptor subunit TctC
VLDLIGAGQVKAIAVGTTERSAFLPGLPTIAETVPGYVATSYMGLLAPARTPSDIVVKLASACAEVLRDAEIVGKLRALGASTAANGPDAFRGFIGERIAAVMRLVEVSGLRFN